MAAVAPNGSTRGPEPDPYERRAFVFHARRKHAGARLAHERLFLLKPQRASADYDLWFRDIRSDDEITKYDIAQALSSPTPPNGWLGYDRVKSGFFYSRNTAGVREPLSVLPGQRLVYLRRTGTLDAIGPVWRVRVLRTGLRHSVEAFRNAERYMRTVQLAVRERATATAASRTPAPPMQQPAPPDAPPSAAQLTWEILPKGWWRLGQHAGFPRVGANATHPDASVRLERLIFLDTLNPIAWYAGSHLGDRRYYVATFPGVAVADTPDWGNALYYYRTSGDSWQSVFRLSKIEALRAGASRIYHSEGWQERLRHIVRNSGR